MGLNGLQLPQMAYFASTVLEICVCVLYLFCLIYIEILGSLLKNFQPLSLQIFIFPSLFLSSFRVLMTYMLGCCYCLTALGYIFFSFPTFLCLCFSFGYSVNLFSISLILSSAKLSLLMNLSKALFIYVLMVLISSLSI